MAALYDHPTPDRFIVGTIGLPGERTFLLQAKSGNALTTVVVEKEQVEILSDRITELLDMVMIKDPAARVPQTALDDLIDNAGLNVPIEPEFRVGTMSLGWDTVKHELVIRRDQPRHARDGLPHGPGQRAVRAPQRPRRPGP